MSKKPKAADYQPSEADKASASVAMAEYQFFKQNYDPLLQQMRDKSLTEDLQSGLRARANADTMQALSAPSFQQSQNIAAAGDMAQAYTGQLGVASASAKDIQNKMQSNVLGIARGQAADAQTGMAQASRLATSEALARAQAKQEVAQAKYAAAGKLVGSLGIQGLRNIKSGGTFFTPAKTQPGTDRKEPVKGLQERLNYTGFLG